MKTFHHYDIAYRTEKNGIFKVIDNPPFGWVADPFLVEYQGAIYLFAEIFLCLSERNGVIGYCKYEEGKFGEWTVSMDRHWHLSYPNVFVEDEKLYMIPESYQLGEVVKYELVEFPNKWKKVCTYISDVEYCDSTFLEYKDGNQYMFTFERKAGSAAGNGYIFQISDGKLSNKRLFSDCLLGARCGGKVIEENGVYIRVAQDCEGGYGSGLVFFEIDEIQPEFREHEIKRLYPTDIAIDSDKEYTGLHTYNRLRNIEVIDLKYVSSSKEEEEASERVHKVFLNKY